MLIFMMVIRFRAILIKLGASSIMINGFLFFDGVPHLDKFAGILGLHVFNIIIGTIIGCLLLVRLLLLLLLVF